MPRCAPAPSLTLSLACALLVLLTSSVRAQDDKPLPDCLNELVLRAQLGQFWGAALVVQDGKTLLASGYGLANDSLSPINSKTLFDIGSVAKQFTSALALRLHHAKRLSLDVPITTYFAELPPAAARITLRHLLTHTSGLSDSSGAIQNLDFADRDEAVRLAFQNEPETEPGEHFEYCNGGYCVAAAIIERAAGQPFQTLMRDEIFRPAGLENTGFLDGEGLDLSNAAARILTSRGGEVRRTILQDGWGWGLRGCGGILMSLEDIARWDAALRTDTLLSQAARLELYSPALEGYALGWNVETTFAGDLKVSHGGGTRGFRSYLLRIPSRAIAVAVLTNDRHDPVGLGNKLLEQLLPSERKGVDVSLHLGGLTLNQYKAAVIGEGVVLNILPENPERLTLTIDVPSTGGSARTVAARITMSAAEARRVAASIRQTLGRKPAGQRTPAGIEATIATAPYTAQDATIHIPAEAQLTIMPRYTGTGPDGKQIIDQRVCLVVIDEANSFWPLILKLDRPTAERLAQDLAPAVKP